MYPKVYLDPARLRDFLKIQHPWIFSRAIVKTELPRKELHGRLVSVFCGNDFLCHGYFNEKSQIAIRVLSCDVNESIDHAFFVQKILKATEMREKFVLSADTTACRFIFSESDALPGFIVDKYNDSLVLQISTLGAENLKKIFVDALVEVVNPKVVLEKSSGYARVMDGLTEDHTEFLYGAKFFEEIILEHRIQYFVDLEKGQKTGFFLDQRENRQTVRRMAEGLRVLNLFSYTGGFSLASIYGGAVHVTSVDVSESALKMCTRNFELNHIENSKHTEVVADAFDFLKKGKAGEYDCIILDPPAFVKSAKDLVPGLKGYTMLNSLALQALSFDGLLFTSSCSGAIDSETFSRMLTWAQKDAGWKVQILEKRGHAMDHPLLPNFPEAEYLKFVVGRKM